MMDDERPDARTDAGLPHPGDDPRVAATLTAVVSRLTEPPDEVTTRRHLAAIRTAAHDPDRQRVDEAGRGRAPHDATAAGALGWRLLRRSTIAAAAAVALLAMLAGGGLLPHPAQQVVAETAHRLGVSLPVPATSGEDDGPAGQPRAGEPTDAQDAADADTTAADADTTGNDADTAGDETTADRKAPDDGLRAAEQPIDEMPAAAADRAAGMGRPASSAGDTPRTHPLWDIHPSERTPPARDKASQRPAEPGPPAVDPPAPVPTPAPGGRDPGPPAGQGKASTADPGPRTPRSDKAAPQAQQAPRAVPGPPQGRHR